MIAPVTDPAEIARGLTKAQREWLLSMKPTTEEQSRGYETIFDVHPYIETAPAIFDYTGRLMIPADKLWFASLGCEVGGRAWATLTETGVAIRDYLRGEA